MRAPLVVVVAYRSDGLLRRCLETLGGELAVLVVDNDASIGTQRLCEDLGAHYRATERNLGFAAAVNLGLEASDGRDVLLLNPDAEISPRDVLSLQSFLHDVAHHRGAVGPHLSGTGESDERASWPMPSPLQTWADAFGLSDRLTGRRFVTGAVLMLRAEAIAEIGGFDERYFLYAEESDWQRRAQDAGWEVAVDESLQAWHVGGASSSDNDRRDYYFFASSRAFARRWYGASGASVMRAGSLAAAARRTVVGPDRTAGRRAMRQLVGDRRPPSSAPRPSVVHVVCTSNFAGVEQSVVDIASEQHRRGWRVTVVGGDPVRMRTKLPPAILLLPGGNVRQALRSLLRVAPADIVHTHMTAAEIAGALAKRRTKARLVTTRHFAATRGSTTVGRMIAGLAARRIDDQVAISEFVATSVESPSHVVPNGVLPSVTERPREKSVLVLQRLEAEKQTDVAIRAWAASGLAEQGWSMVIHGRGALRAELERLATRLGCGKSVDFRDFTDQPRAVLGRARILLASAPAEPFGLTVAEAMAEGTPVVAADGGAHREILGSLGRYFPPGDVAAAAAALVELAQSPGPDRAVLSDQLRARQQERFTVAAQVSGLLSVYRGSAPEVALTSLEPWDEIWRRNQHLASRLVRGGHVSRLLFINPPRGGLALRATRSTPEPGIEVVTPPLLVPRRWGGHRLLGSWLRRATHDVELFWINDPVAGWSALPSNGRAIYDVTDDWRELDQPAAERSRIVAAEDALATRASTVVCSETLASRWLERYGLKATLIGNGVDVHAIRAAKPRTLTGLAPHVVYVGTAHPNRIDTVLLRRLAGETEGTLHLVGPESLDDDTRSFLDEHGAQRHGPVPSADVPSWLASADVLICPHLVDEFTLSLDAIKAYEYLATDAPIVATPSSGFEQASAPGLVVVDARHFVRAVKLAVGTGPFDRPPPPDWDDRASQFAAVLRGAMDEANQLANR